MDRLKFDTKKSLYPEVELEVDEVVYKSRKRTREFLLTIEPIEVSIEKNEEGAIYKWVTLMFGIPDEVLNALAFQEVEDIYLETSTVFRDEQRERMKKRIDEMKKFTEDLADIADVKKELPLSKKKVTKSGKRKSSS